MAACAAGIYVENKKILWNMAAGAAGIAFEIKNFFLEMEFVLGLGTELKRAIDLFFF